MYVRVFYGYSDFLLLFNDMGFRLNGYPKLLITVNVSDNECFSLG